MMTSRSIIHRPLITEKMAKTQEAEHRYAFAVDPRANKIQIARAVEEVFDVSVVDVHTSAVHGKVKRLGRFSGKRPSWKKAIVRLKAGDTIQLFEGV
jgi:large subunit ribosomal protein L23